MKNYLKFLIIAICFVSVYKVVSYSTYGAPAEFGNDSLTTCYVGGDLGIINCTGNISTTAGIFNGNGSGLDSITQSTGFPDFVFASWSNVTYDAELAYISNCSVDQSCANVIYTTDKLGNTTAEIRAQFGNSSNITFDSSTGSFFYNGTDATIANCSAANSCANIIYETELNSESELESQLTDVSDVYTNNDGSLGNTTLEIEGVCWENVTRGEWIIPAYVLD